MADIAAIEARHHYTVPPKRVGPKLFICAYDAQEWPCDTEVMRRELEEMTEQRAEWRDVAKSINKDANRMYRALREVDTGWYTYDEDGVTRVRYASDLIERLMAARAVIAALDAMTGDHNPLPSFGQQVAYKEGPKQHVVTAHFPPFDDVT